MALADNIIRELRTYFLSLDRKNVVSGDIKPDSDDSYRLGAPDKKWHAIYATRVIADNLEGDAGSGGEAGHADTLGVDYLTAEDAVVVGQLYPLQDDGSGNGIFPENVLPDGLVFENTTPTFTSINVINYVDGIAVGSHNHSGNANMGQQINHADLTNLSADHHTIYTRWDDTETVIKKWKFSNKADDNQSFNEYVGWEVEASVALSDDGGGVYHPNMATSKAVLQTLNYSNPDAVATVSIGSGGTEYAVNDILTLVGGNNDCTVQVDTVGTAGDVTGVSVILEGSGYSVSNGYVTTVSPSAITEISINSGGTNYEIGDIIVVSGGDEDAQLYVSSIGTAGDVAGIVIYDGGSGYAESTGTSTTGGSGTGCTVDIDNAGGSGCTIDVDSLRDYSAYEHSYPLQIISHAQYAAITLGSGQEILIKTDDTDTWIDVENIKLSAADGITIGTTFEVTQAGALTATSGHIANWKITEDQLESDTGDVILDGDGYIQLSGGTGVEIKLSVLSSDYRIWVGSQGESNFDETTAKFMVSPAGKVTAESVFIKSGLQSYSAGKWNITSDGNAEFESIKARGRLDTLVFSKNTVSSISGVVSLSNGAVLAQTIYGDGAIGTTSINAGGSGYAIEDVITISGGTQLATLQVSGVSSGVVTSYNVLTYGSGYSVGSANATTTDGSGTGFTIDIDTIESASTTIYVDSPDLDFGEIIIVQSSADELEWMLVISTYTSETIYNADGEAITAYKYSVSRDYDAYGTTYTYQEGVSLNGRGSYSVGNDPLPLASGDEQSAFGDYQPSGTYTGAGGGWITLDGENAFIGVDVRTGPLPSQYQNFIRIGNLQGVLTYDTVEWGFFIGDENEYFSYDDSGLTYYTRDGDTTITSTGITSDAMMLSLVATDPADYISDTMILYYESGTDVLQYMANDSLGSGDVKRTLATQNWVSSNYVDYDTPVIAGDIDGQDSYGIINIDRVVINQSADGAGIEINGYDDESSNNLKIYIDSNGNSILYKSDGEVLIAQSVGGTISLRSDNINMRLGDNIGGNTFQLYNSSWSEVLSINSLGHIEATSIDVKRTIEIVLLPNDTALSAEDDFSGFYWTVPEELNGYNITDVDFSVATASSSGTPEFQLYNVTDSADILSTTCTIDATETTSYTASTAAVINTSNDDLDTGDQIRFDCDTAGTGTKGCTVLIVVEKP